MGETSKGGSEHHIGGHGTLTLTNRIDDVQVME